MRILLIIGCMVLSGCSLMHRLPTITIPGGAMGDGVTVKGPADAGKPATVSTASQQEGMKLPKGSTFTVTETAAQPATEKEPQRPATKVYQVQLSADTEWYQRAQQIAANTGTIDTTIAAKRIDAEERRPLLWIAIAGIVAAVVLRSAMPAWPMLSNAAGIAAVLSFAAWKFAEIPAWVGLGVLLLGGAIMLGYKRAEWDANGNGIPDALERKTS